MSPSFAAKKDWFLSCLEIGSVTGSRQTMFHTWEANLEKKVITCPNIFYDLQSFYYPINRPRVWSSLVEGDEQLDRPNSQTTMELCRKCVA